MRVLFVTRYVDHVLLSFLHTLAEHVELRVVYDFDNGWNDELTARGVATTRLVARSRFDKSYRKSIAGLCAERAVDLVQCFHGNAELANLIAWSRGDVPLVGYRGRIGHLKFRESPAAYWSVRNPKLAAVVANSSAVAAYLRGFRWLRPGTVRIIPTGVDTAWIGDRLTEPYPLRDKLGLAPDAFVVMSLGSLRPVKNFKLTVAAARSLAPLGVQFVHLGDHLGWKSKAGGIDNLHFIDFERNPFPVIANADLFTTTSHGEAFSRASLEAMACGKAVVGPRAGGSVDLIEDGVNGAFFAPNDDDDLVAKIRSYVDDRERAAAHGRNAFATVAEKFSTQRMVEAYLGLYENVLDGSRRA